MNPKSDRSAEDIRRRAERLQRSRRSPGASPLRGLGVFGMIGWSIAVPTVGGAFLGLWLNQVAPQKFSWPIALILGGVVVGGIIAWSWVSKETQGQNEQNRERPNDRGDG